MSSKGVTRRTFFENVVKYCGAGVAALGLRGVERAHAGALAVPDLDEPVQSGIWRMRDAQLHAVWGIYQKRSHTRGLCREKT